MNNKTFYGKIIDGELKIHGPQFPIQNENGSITVTSSSELLIANGFKKIIYTIPEPKEGYIESYFEWIETDTEIVQTWSYEPIAEESQFTTEERLEAIELLLLEMLGVEI